MRQKSRWKTKILFFIVFVAVQGNDEASFNNQALKTIFSPRVDYDQWKPVGRGDPLKNDPTFDYVPPVLEQVHYWIEPDSLPTDHAQRKSDNGPKTEMLLLGVPSKKPAVPNPPPAFADSRRDTIFETIPKYQDKNPFFNMNINQGNSQSSFLSSVTSQILPSIMSFANKIMDKTLHKGEYLKPPYTVLVPPPPQITTRPAQVSFSSPVLKVPVTRKPITFNPYISSPNPPVRTTRIIYNIPKTTHADAGVSVVPSNLIYHSSSIGSQKEFETVSSIHWELPASSEVPKGKLAPPKTVLRIPFSSKMNRSTSVLEASHSNHNINYVTPPPLDENHVVHKGQVSDVHDMSDSYVKIEKPQAQMDHVGIDVNSVPPTIIYSPSAAIKMPGMNNEAIRQMEFMKPPPLTLHNTYAKPPNYLASILQKEKSSFESSNFIGSSSSITNTFVSSPDIKSSPILPTMSPMPFVVTTELTEETSTSPTTNIITENPSILTTDPLFKHYKQSVEQIRGPPYLIIQGHSKVKTYKPAKQRNGIMVQEGNEIPYIRENTYEYKIKHLHGFETKRDLEDISEQIANDRKAKTGHLQTLKHVVQTGYGAIDLDDTKLDRSGQDFQEAELTVGYRVPDDKYTNTEKYRKGIVEGIDDILR